jgi:hypothetical protein
MNQGRLVREVKRIVLHHCGNELVSLYITGSFLSREMTGSSDIDFIGLMKPSFDFRKEPQINRALNDELHPSHKIDLGTMSYDEFFGGGQKGSLMRYIELPIFLNFLKRARLIYGKRIIFDNLPIEPASPKDELAYHIKVFEDFKEHFRKKDRVRSDFAFRDFIKIVFYIANLELHLKKNTKPKRSYFGIVRSFKEDKSHIVHYSMKLRRKKSINHQEKKLWLDSAETYVAKMKALTASG